MDYRDLSEDDQILVKFADGSTLKVRQDKESRDGRYEIIFTRKDDKRMTKEYFPTYEEMNERFSEIMEQKLEGKNVAV